MHVSSSRPQYVIDTYDTIKTRPKSGYVPAFLIPSENISPNFQPFFFNQHTHERNKFLDVNKIRLEFVFNASKLK